MRIDQIVRTRIGLVLCLVLAVAGLSFGEESSSKQARGKFGVVAAAHPLAAQAGLEMLELGGNAADAAVATAFALTVVEPFGSSIGGDGTALIYTAKSGETESINYRCAAPRKASTEVLDYSNRKAWNTTPLAPGVPGMVAGTCALHERHGRLPLATVMAPAIRYAEEGFEVSPKLATIIFDHYAVFETNETSGAIFLDDGFPHDAGAVIRNPDLAASLRLIADEGPDAFYKGKLAKRIHAYMKDAGGLIRKKDLAAYRPRVGEPVWTDYRGLRVMSAPPPFGGIPVLQNLNVLARLPLDFTRPHTDPMNLHLMAETMKGVSRDRRDTIGDPEFTDVAVDYLLSDAYADARAAMVVTDRALGTDEIRFLEPPEKSHEGCTTHLSVMDGEGNAVALTQTLGHFFGSGVMVPGTGIMFNNQMNNFTGYDDSPNSLVPGKWMRSTQAPVIVTHDDEVILVVGSPGAYRIITTMAQILVNYIDFGMSLAETVDAPRFSARHNHETLKIESRFPDATITELEELGHEVELFKEFDLYFGGVHAVSRDPARNLLIGAADRRRDGVAMSAGPQVDAAEKP